MKAIIAAVAVAVALAGCGSGDTKSTDPAATQPAATSLNSKLIPLTLPEHSTLTGSDAGVEIWDTHVPQYAARVDIKSRLPIGKDLDGLKWCSEDDNTKLQLIEWSWGDFAEMAVVSVDKDGQVSISRRKDDPGGC